MPHQPKTLDELLADYEPERQAALARDLARYDSPEEVAKREARRKAQEERIEREIAAGYRDINGDPIVYGPDEEDDRKDDENE